MKLSNQYPSLAGKVVLISGGATGIGASLVEAFCRQQAQVAIVDIINDEGHALVAALDGQEGCSTPSFYPCDIRDVEAYQAVVAQIKQQLGPVAVLVNNAASDFRHSFTEMTPEYWDDRIAVNLRHAFFAIQAVFPHMQSLGGGSVINFGSMSWYECQGGMPGYTTSKAGMEGMTRGMARDLGKHNIRINTLVPGWVMTERQLRDWVDASTKDEIEQSQCLKDSLMPEDISAMALFLASDDSKMCTAQNFIVDGGWI